MALKLYLDDCANSDLLADLLTRAGQSKRLAIVAILAGKPERLSHGVLNADFRRGEID